LTPLERSASVFDWLADVVGILLGLALFAALARRRHPAR
jgi:VanZ family protein